MLGPASYGYGIGGQFRPSLFYSFASKRTTDVSQKGSEFMREIFQKAVSCMTHAFQSNVIFGAAAEDLKITATAKVTLRNCEAESATGFGGDEMAAVRMNSKVTQMLSNC